MPRLSIANLSFYQALGFAVTTVGSSGVWFLATAIAQPAQLGSVGRVLSVGTFVAGLVTAGLGQFILTIVNSTEARRLRWCFWTGLVAGSLLSVLIAGLVGVFQDRQLGEVAWAIGLLAGGVAASNLQDAIYLGTGYARDVPAKAVTIILLRLILLVGCLLYGTGLLPLLVAFVAPQLIVGIGWAVARGSVALRRHVPDRAAAYGSERAWSTLALSYLYSTGVAVIVVGVPAIVTSLTTEEQSGKFYVAWMLTAVLGSVAVGIANSVLAASLGAQDRVRTLLRLLLTVGATISVAGLSLALVVPKVLGVISPHYEGISGLLAPLLAGQLFFALALVSLAAFRTLALKRHVLLLLLFWPTTVAASVLAGLEISSVAGGINGYLVANATAAALIGTVTFRVAIEQDHLSRRAVMELVS